MKRVVIYTRVSRDDSGEGRSNQRQEEACRALCAARGWEVAEVREDISISAYSGAGRPGWEAVLELIRTAQVDIVVAWHLDRMTRSMIDLENLILLAEDNNVGVATATGDIDLTTDVGRMVARILAAVARAEVERKSARQKLANRQRAVQGKPHMSGPRPFGYEEDRLTARQLEADAFRGAVDDYLSGAETLASIARSFAERGFVSEVTGKAEWPPATIRAMLLNPRYAGIATYLDEEVGTGEWEPLIDRDTHARLVDRLVQGGTGTGRTPTTLLSGIAFCWRCGATVRAGISKNLLAYKCGSRSCVIVPRADADNYVVANLVAMFKEGRLTTAKSPDIAGAQEEIDSLIERQKVLARALGDGSIGVEVWQDANGPLKARLSELQTLVTMSPLGDEFSGNPEKILDELLALPLARQRGVVDELLEVTMIGGVVTGRAKVDISKRVSVLERQRA